MIFEVFWHRFVLFVLAPFRHQWFGVLGCSFLAYLFIAIFLFFCDCATENGAHKSGRGFRGLRPPPPKSFFGAAIVQRTFFYPFGKFLDRFGDDFEDFSGRCSVTFSKQNDKCIYTCAVAESRLATLKI